MNTTALQQFLAELGDVPVATDPGTIKLKSRDFFWVLAHPQAAA